MMGSTEDRTRRVFRSVALALIAYYWFMGLIIGPVDENADRWAGGFSFLSNWNLTLNLVVALGAIMNEFGGRDRFDKPILAAAMGVNIIVLILYWTLKALGQLGEVEAYDSFFDMFRDYYIHGITSVFLFGEAVFYSEPFEDWRRSYGIFMAIFFGYIIWMEAVVSRLDDFPCGKESCGFPYEFLNDLNTTGRLIFYFGVWMLGNLAYGFSYWLVKYKERNWKSIE